LQKAKRNFIFRKWKIYVARKKKERVGILVRMYFLRKRFFTIWKNRVLEIEELRSKEEEEKELIGQQTNEKLTQFIASRKLSLVTNCFNYWNTLAKNKQIQTKHLVLSILKEHTTGSLYRRLVLLKSSFHAWKKKMLAKKLKRSEKARILIHWRNKYNTTVANQHYSQLALKQVFEHWKYNTKIRTDTQKADDYLTTNLIASSFKWWKSFTPVHKATRIRDQEKNLQIKQHFFVKWKQQTVGQRELLAADCFNNYHLVKKCFTTWNAALKGIILEDTTLYNKTQLVFTALKLGVSILRHERKMKSMFFSKWVATLSQRDQSVDSIQNRLNTKVVQKLFVTWKDRADITRKSRLFYIRSTFSRFIFDWRVAHAKKVMSDNRMRRILEAWRNLSHHSNVSVPILRLCFDRWKKKYIQASKRVEENNTEIVHKYFTIWMKLAETHVQTRQVHRELLLKRMFNVWKSRYIQQQSVTQYVTKSDNHYVKVQKVRVFARWKSKLQELRRIQSVQQHIVSLRKTLLFTKWKKRIMKDHYLSLKLQEVTTHKERTLLRSVLRAWFDELQRKKTIVRRYNEFRKQTMEKYLNIWKSKYILKMKEQFINVKVKKNMKRRCLLWWRQKRLDVITKKIQQNRLQKYWEAWKMYVEYNKFRKMKRQVRAEMGITTRKKKRKDRVKVTEKQTETEAIPVVEDLPMTNFHPISTPAVIHQQVAEPQSDPIEPLDFDKILADSPAQVIKKAEKVTNDAFNILADLEEKIEIPPALQTPQSSVGRSPHTPSSTVSTRDNRLSDIIDSFMIRDNEAPSCHTDSPLILKSAVDSRSNSHVLEQQLQQLHQDLTKYDEIDPHSVNQRIWSYDVGHKTHNAVSQLNY
jgi:hypothetical protein